MNQASKLKLNEHVTSFKITLDVLRIVEAEMQRDDETTAVQLQKILVDSGHPLCLQTILTSRDKLGWTFRGSAYCQLIRDVNKVKNQFHVL